MPPFIFSSSTQRPDDLSAEDHWRSFTYLQHITGAPEDAYSSCLSWVQCCRFAWRLPLNFELFGGRVASLGIDRMGLEPGHVTDLLHAVAGVGARVPGMALKLRVARPWLALFEDAVGDERQLPEDWPEALELHGDPVSVWIGNRVPDSPLCPNLLDPNSDSVHRARKQYAEVDWNQYQQVKHGWQLRGSAALPAFLTETG